VPTAEIEEVIRSLNSIISTRVVIGKEGAIEEIHVLADARRVPKQVVRDVESALMAKFGIELDHKKISVAQTNDGKQFRFCNGRLKFSDVSISMNGAKSEATVHLTCNDDIYTGVASGHGSSHNQLRLIATATLRAVENSQSADGTLLLEDLNPSVMLSGRNITVVCVNMITRRGEDYLSGSAVVKQDLWKSVVNATLDAVNRRLGSEGEG
jgi:predicted nucleic-acid-binding protein